PRERVGLHTVKSPQVYPDDHRTFLGILDGVEPRKVDVRDPDGTQGSPPLEAEGISSFDRDLALRDRQRPPEPAPTAKAKDRHRTGIPIGEQGTRSEEEPGSRAPRGPFEVISQAPPDGGGEHERRDTDKWSVELPVARPISVFRKERRDHEAGDECQARNRLR